MNRLKEIRIYKKMTQKELSNLANISQSVLSQYESGQVDPSATAIIQLCNALQISSDYLLGRSDELGVISINDEYVFSTNATEQRLILDFRKLPKQSKDYIVGIVHNLAMTS